ncbi:MAG: hypothetical protein V1834_03190 [Candidatus Micrarchaeota archaeon]
MNEGRTAALILLSCVSLAALYYAVGLQELGRECGWVVKQSVKQDGGVYFYFCRNECYGVYVSPALARQMAEGYADVYALKPSDFVCFSGVKRGDSIQLVSASGIQGG